MNDCSTALPYLSPWTDNDEDNVENTVNETTSTPVITETVEPEPTSPLAVTEEVTTSSDAAVFVNGAKSLLLVALTSMAFLY